MNPYVGYSKSNHTEYGDLIFANTAKEARAVGLRDGAPVAKSRSDYKVRWLRNKLYLNAQADQQKFRAGAAHVAVPDSCLHCFTWAVRLNEAELCAECAEEIEQGW